MAKRTKPYKREAKPEHDKCVIYYSPRDECWIGHSLHTDQIGTGESVLGALVEVMMAIDSLIELKRENRDIQFRRDAPDSILKLVEGAQELPQVLYERACQMARGSERVEELARESERVEELAQGVDEWAEQVGHGEESKLHEFNPGKNCCLRTELIAVSL